MPATLGAALVDGSPGNVITLTGSGLSAGVGASVVLQGQGIPPAPLPLPAIFSGSAVAFTVPDGARSGTLVVTASDGTAATCALNVSSQYCQASQYSPAIEGTVDNVSGLATGLLDQALRDASAFIDSAIGVDAGLRLYQVQEDHSYRPARGGRGPRVRPSRGPTRGIPLVSLDAFSFYVNNQLMVTFEVAGQNGQIYTNFAAGYFEVQGFALGNSIIGPSAVLQGVGYSPDVARIVYTSGYGWLQTPREVRKATAIIATELMVNAGVIERGLGGYSRVREGDVQYDRRNEIFDIPIPAAKLLKRWTGTAF